MTTQPCSHCGEPRAEGQVHDSQRCWTISHAIVAVGRDTATEVDRHVYELSRWLGAHPAGHCGAQARRDREASLDRWVRIAAE